MEAWQISAIIAVTIVVRREGIAGPPNCIETEMYGNAMLSYHLCMAIASVCAHLQNPLVAPS